ncbi:MAG TPA: tRNA (adenosine(37)-N6)-dimethylallyltransferase MiaA [Bacilli bacterium]|jgi:tRNA dimethylallyltransferase|nr:tRNA (adenosine(37)-N6)-dimethylallyltransferase MiaA [Bacilli bacterium]HQM18297.1 tRNA (adenosine(37)-N6)-dimethylallyltransferase MiaA [Bacilli bacterium]
MIKVIGIVGATGSGKTYLSNILAKKFNGEIINTDASSFRKRLDIGTAKVKQKEMFVKHHLIDFLSPIEEYSINNFQKDCRGKIQSLNKQNKTIFLVGGSMLYLNSVIYDYQFSKVKRDKKKYLEYSNEELYEYLLELDPSLKDKYHPNNRRRIERAIDLIEDDSLKKQQTESKFYDTLIIFLNPERKDLYERINNRVDEMIEQGWIEEVKALKEDGINLSLVKEIGYKELDCYLDGKISLDDAKKIIAQKTRNYAKRQITWYRNKLDCIEVKVDYNNLNEALEEAEELIRSFLDGKITEENS